MPLNLKILSEIPDPVKLPQKTALTALLWGTACIITPFPQLFVSRSSDWELLLTAMFSPVCGIIIMSCILFKSEQNNALTLKRMTLCDIFCAVKGTAVIILSYTIVNAVWRMLLLALSIPFEESQSLMKLAQTCSGKEFLLLWGLVSVIVPFAEELLFRRILFAVLLPFGVKTALFGTSFLFAAVHLFLAGLPGLFVIGTGVHVDIMRGNISVSRGGLELGIISNDLTFALDRTVIPVELTIDQQRFIRSN